MKTQTWFSYRNTLLDSSAVFLFSLSPKLHIRGLTKSNETGPTVHVFEDPQTSDAYGIYLHPIDVIHTKDHHGGAIIFLPRAPFVTVRLTSSSLFDQDANSESYTDS